MTLEEAGAVYILDSAKGGYLNHWRVRGTTTAACGFRPEAKVERNRQMALRHGWKGAHRMYSMCGNCAGIVEKDILVSTAKGE